MSLFYEDFIDGQSYRSVGREPMSAKTIEAFAQLSGDKNPIHLEEEFARKSPFGSRIAHGLLGLSLASGLLHDLGLLNESILAFAALDWKFRSPVLIGDSLTLEMTVGRRRAMGGKAGLVIFDAQLLNQKGETVQEGKWSLMMRRKA